MKFGNQFEQNKTLVGKGNIKEMTDKPLKKTKKAKPKVEESED